MKKRFFIPIIYSKRDTILLVQPNCGRNIDKTAIESYQEYLDQSHQTTEEFDPVVTNMFSWFMEDYKLSS